MAFSILSVDSSPVMLTEPQYLGDILDNHGNYLIRLVGRRRYLADLVLLLGSTQVVGTCHTCAPMQKQDLVGIGGPTHGDLPPRQA